jgi:hypothetical protein
LTFNGTLRAATGSAALTVNITKNTVAVSGYYNTAMHVSSGTSPPYGNLNATIEGNKVSVNRIVRAINNVVTGRRTGRLGGIGRLPRGGRKRGAAAEVRTLLQPVNAGPQSA